MRPFASEALREALLSKMSRTQDAAKRANASAGLKIRAAVPRCEVLQPLTVLMSVLLRTPLHARYRKTSKPHPPDLKASSKPLYSMLPF